jgi:hypothetical protein
MSGATRPQAPTGTPRLKFPWGKAVPAMVMFAIFLLVPVVSTLEIPQAYETSVAFLRDNQGLERALGGRADWGPIPLFFWKETEGPHEAWRGSFIFLVKGPNATIVVCVDLRKAGQARGAWQIGDENFYLDTAGNRKPLPKEESMPKPPKPSRT